jgi:hypothetical protein
MEVIAITRLKPGTSRCSKGERSGRRSDSRRPGLHFGKGTLHHGWTVDIAPAVEFTDMQGFLGECARYLGELAAQADLLAATLRLALPKGVSPFVESWPRWGASRADAVPSDTAPASNTTRLGNHSAEQLAQGRFNLGRLIGLPEKSSTGRKVSLQDIPLAGCHDESHGRPTVPHHLGKTEAVYRAGHLHIGEYRPNVVSAFEDADSFVGIRSSYGLEPGFLYHSHRVHTDQTFILHYKHYRPVIGNHATHLAPTTALTLAEAKPPLL